MVNTWETRGDGLYCSASRGGGKSTPSEEERREEEARLLEVAGWKWEAEPVRRGECRVIQWEWKSVVKRLVRSRAGIVFLGGEFEGATSFWSE